MFQAKTESDLDALEVAQVGLLHDRCKPVVLQEWCETARRVHDEHFLKDRYVLPQLQNRWPKTL